MIAAMLLFTVASADLVGAPFVRRGAPARVAPFVSPGFAVGAALALVLAALGWLLLDVPLPAAVVIALVALGWLVVVRLFTARGHTAPLLTGAIALVAVLAAAVALGPYLAPTRLPGTAFAIAAVGTIFFLTRPANLVCRALLGRSLAAHRGSDEDESGPDPSPGTAVAEPRRWTLSLRSREIGRVEETAPSASSPDPSTEAEPAAGSLKGGRVIGPLERILITGLALVGAQAVIVGSLAAKGIVRFPEISADGRRGSKAEEFLVGSLVSWTIAGLAAAYLAALQNSL